MQHPVCANENITNHGCSKILQISISLHYIYFCKICKVKYVIETPEGIPLNSIQIEICLITKDMKLKSTLCDHIHSIF